MTTRLDRLAESLDQVIRGMDLRDPQEMALRKVHELVCQFPGPLSQCEPGDIPKVLARAEESVPVLTFALATGVGKTRLMGAIAAYLFNAGEASTFMFLAPRDAVLRKLEAECREASPKYIFVDRRVVAQPRLCHRGNLLTFNPKAGSKTLFGHVPNVFVVSPQLLAVPASRARLARRSEFSGTSILQYLKDQTDLVVMIDESHHLDPDCSTADERSWASAMAAVTPRLAFAMTATPRATTQPFYEYNLTQCLRDGLYTKAVRLIVEECDPAIDDAAYDRLVLEAALYRLGIKEAALETLRERRRSFPTVRPVALVCARDQNHANEIGRILEAEYCLSPSEILVIHAARKTEQDLLRLSALENAGSEVRVIVQVHVLDEGWDVSNVYVIAPLRRVQSYTNGRQVMGRGLRLPVGSRVGIREVDTLDVLAFGQDTFKEIYRQATAEFGQDSDVQVVRGAKSEGCDGAPPVNVRVTADTARKPFVASLNREFRVAVRLADPVMPEPDIDSAIPPLLRTRGLRALDVGAMRTERVSRTGRIPTDQLVALTTRAVIETFDPLSFPMHEETISRLVKSLLPSETTSHELDPRLLKDHLVEHLEARYLAKPLSFRATPHFQRLIAAPIRFWLPTDCVPTNDWQGPGIPIAGWSYCAHSAASFNNESEWQLAKKLDAMNRLWLRNNPAVLLIPKLAGYYQPGFLMIDEDRLFVIDVIDPDVRPHETDWPVFAWAEAINSTNGGVVAKACVVVGSDVTKIQTITDLQRFGESRANL